jgi:hypothetical protein
MKPDSRSQGPQLKPSSPARGPRRQAAERVTYCATRLRLPEGVQVGPGEHRTGPDVDIRAWPSGRAFRSIAQTATLQGSSNGTKRDRTRRSPVLPRLVHSGCRFGRCRQGPGSTLVRCGRGPRHGCPGQRRRDLRQVRGHFYAPACSTRVEPEPAHIWQALSAHVDHRPCVGWASTVVTRDSHPCTTGVARVQVICR